MRDRHRLLERKAFPRTEPAELQLPVPAVSTRTTTTRAIHLLRFVCCVPTRRDRDRHEPPRTESPAGPRGFRGRGAGNPRDFSWIAREGSVPAARAGFFFLGSPRGLSAPDFARHGRHGQHWRGLLLLLLLPLPNYIYIYLIYIYIRGTQLVTIEGKYQSGKKLAEKNN